MENAPWQEWVPHVVVFISGAIVSEVWTVRCTAFFPVRNTALAPSQVIPSLCSLCCSMKNSRKGSDLGNLTILIKFLLLRTVALLGFVLIQNTWNKITQQIVWEGCFSLVPTGAGSPPWRLPSGHSVQWGNARTCIIQLLVLGSSTFKIGYKNCSWI